MIKFIFILIIALANIILGLFIISKYRKILGNIFFGLMCVSGGLWALTNGLLYSNFFENYYLVIKILFVFAILAPLFYLLFAYHFPIKTKLYSKTSNYIIYFIPSILIIFVILGVFKIQTVLIVDKQVYQPVVFHDFLIFSVYFFYYVSWGVILLLQKYFGNLGIYKIQIRLVILATLITFALTGFVSIILPLLGISNYDWLGGIFTSIFFFIVGYLLFYKRERTV